MILLADSTSPLGFIVVASMIIGPVYCFYRYYKSKVSLITIQYAGGEIGFDKKWFVIQEIDLFQKQLRMAKDREIEEDKNSVANKMEQTIITMSSQNFQNKSISKIDELTKLGDLLEKGIVTQEEFDKMKKELM